MPVPKLSSWTKSARARKLGELLSLTADFLNMLVDETCFVVAVFDKPWSYLYWGHEEFRRRLAESEREPVRETVKRLKKRGLIEQRKTAGRLTFALTEKGLNYLLRRALREAGSRRDGRRIYVIFDIPVTMPMERRRLRNFLKSCGFVRIQQSVWSTDKDALDPLRKWLVMHRLEKWIRIIFGELV